MLGSEISIRDPADQDVAPGTIGEIVVRGACVMQGYWNKPDVSAKTLRGGWLHTGDLGYLDEAGFLFIVDRLKDMIITGGENVYSTEVEEVVYAYPGVSQCAVIGIPDERWGEAVHAIVVARAGVELSEAAMHRALPRTASPATNVRGRSRSGPSRCRSARPTRSTSWRCARLTGKTGTTCWCDDHDNIEREGNIQCR